MVALGVRKLPRFNHIPRDKVEKSLQEEHTVQVSSHGELIIGDPSCKDAVIKDLLIENAANDDLLGIFKVKDHND